MTRPGEELTDVGSLHTVHISVGSNLGDALAHVRYGISRLAEHPQILLTATSAIYRTAPVDFTDQDWFVNAVLRVETSLDPHALLAVTQTVQADAGQGPKTVRFGPRILDLDLLFYGDLILDTPRLELPHPRMHKRRFVLQPICDIDPQLVHPVLGLSMADLLAGLKDDQQEVARIDA